MKKKEIQRLARKLWRIGHEAALKVNPAAPMRPWKEHQPHIKAGFYAIAEWYVKQKKNKHAE